jgi:hypothetical protein
MTAQASASSGVFRIPPSVAGSAFVHERPENHGLGVSPQRSHEVLVHERHIDEHAI